MRSGSPTGSAAWPFVPPPSAAARTSRSTMRPPGPLPVTVRRSMPSSIASDLASGEARSLPPAAGLWVSAAGFSAGLGAGAAAFAAGAAFGATAGLAGAAFGAGACCAGVSFLAAGALVDVSGPFAAGADGGDPLACDFACSTSLLTSSPALPMIATGAPSLTVSPSLTRNFNRTPSSSMLKSMFALSVSTSATRSPGETLSPSFFVQRTRTPSSIVGESFGKPMICATSRSNQSR